MKIILAIKLVLIIITLSITQSTDITTKSNVLFSVDGNKSDTIVNKSGKLELYSSAEPLVGDFEVRLKIVKMKAQGFLLLGFNRDKAAVGTEKYFAIDNVDGWGLSSNGYVCEYGKWSILPIAFLNQGNEIKLIRKNNILAFSIDGIFSSYGYLMESELYLTVNMKNEGDSIKIIS